MKRQVHFNFQEPRASQMEPRKNNMYKPTGGIWTSTDSPDQHTQWASVYSSLELQLKAGIVCSHWRWKKAVPPIYCYEMIPKETARIFHIDCQADLLQLGKLYGWDARQWFAANPHTKKLQKTNLIHSLNFVSISKDFDGLHLTENGVIETKKQGLYRLETWDAECTIWFRWAFEKVEHLGTLERWREGLTTTVNTALIL